MHMHVRALLASLAIALSAAGCSRQAKIIPMDRPYEVSLGQNTPDKEIRARRLMRLINTERVRRGLQALQWSGELHEIANLHSRNMAQAQQVGLDGLSDLTQTVDFTASYYHANVTRGPNIFHSYEDAVVDPVQHSNLLDPNITHVGIGYHQVQRAQWLPLESLPFYKPSVWFTQVYAQNPEAWVALREKRAFQAFIAEQIRTDKEFDEQDLNMTVFRQRLNDGDVPGTFQISTPALERAFEEPQTWSVLEDSDDDGYQTTDDQPVEILIEEETDDSEELRLEEFDIADPDPITETDEMIEDADEPAADEADNDDGDDDDGDFADE